MASHHHRRVLLCVASLGLFSAAPARALLTLQVSQQGPNVIVNGSGTANTTALPSAGSQSHYTNLLSSDQIYAGPAAFSGTAPDVAVSLWGGLSGPAAFGADPNVFEYPDDNSALSFGDLFGILTSATSADIRLVLPDGYASGTSLSGRSTYTNLSLAQAGLTPGQIYTWSWGSGADADSFELRIGNPQTVPSPLPIAGVAAAFHRLRRLRGRQQRGSSTSA